MKRIFLFFLCTPTFANLYFHMPHTERMQSAEVHLDIAAAHGFYLISGRDEARSYLPELRMHAQFYPRIAVTAEIHGVYRRESLRSGVPFDLRDGGFGFGDVRLGTWLDLRRDAENGPVIKGFFQAKIPAANDEGNFGSDKTDLYLGTTAHWQGPGRQVALMLRMDIIGRPDSRNQWDYLTLGVQSGWDLNRNWHAYFEGYYRTRFSSATWLVGAGIRTNLNRRWSL
jgi:hypothetical protein